MEATKRKTVWLINERSYGTKVGIGTVNRDGSITLSLDALPTGNGKLQVRDYVPRDADSTAAPEVRRLRAVPAPSKSPTV